MRITPDSAAPTADSATAASATASLPPTRGPIDSSATPASPALAAAIFTRLRRSSPNMRANTRVASGIVANTTPAADEDTLRWPQ